MTGQLNFAEAHVAHGAHDNITQRNIAAAWEALGTPDDRQWPACGQ